MATKINPKNSTNFLCDICYFTTCNKNDYKRHLTTQKHFSNILATNGNAKKLFLCENCNKEYNDRTGLWRHKKKCVISNLNCCEDNNIKILNQDTSDKELIMLLIKENSELKNMMIKVLENGTYNNNNNNNNITNSHNKTFNLQFFLNETCKDAMNISDFIESVKLQVADLENVGKVGYIEGISNIIIQNLKALDVEKRPVHCTDQKREVMYVKDDNIWEKEDETNKKLRKAIRMIAHKNICMLKDYREKYPDCEEYDSKKNDQYNKIIYESMGGKGDNDYEKDSKIIKKIAKEVAIEK